MDTAADRLAMVRALGGGVSVSINGRTFPVVFDYEYVTLSTGDGEVESRAPVATATDEDVRAAAVTKGVLVTISTGLSFTVRRLEPDGTGMVRLILGN